MAEGVCVASGVSATSVAMVGAIGSGAGMLAAQGLYVGFSAESRHKIAGAWNTSLSDKSWRTNLMNYGWVATEVLTAALPAVKPLVLGKTGRLLLAGATLEDEADKIKYAAWAREEARRLSENVGAKAWRGLAPDAAHAKVKNEVQKTLRAKVLAAQKTALAAVGITGLSLMMEPFAEEIADVVGRPGLSSNDREQAIQELMVHAATVGIFAGATHGAFHVVSLLARARKGALAAAERDLVKRLREIAPHDVKFVFSD